MDDLTGIHTVFQCDLSDTERVLLLDMVMGIVNRREDRVMIIDLGVPKEENDRIEFVGSPLSPPDERCTVII